MVTCQILKDFLQMELPISIIETTDKTSPSFYKLQWKNLPILVSLWSRIQKSIPICTKDLSIEGAVVPGLSLCSRTKQKPRNNSALYWKVFSFYWFLRNTYSKVSIKCPALLNDLFWFLKKKSLLNDQVHLRKNIL